MTIAERYDPTMTITDQGEADAYFETLVAENMSETGRSREAAELIERVNLGYYAGYYDRDTRLRVERLFRCEHPLLGPATLELSPEEVLARGVAYALGFKAGRDG